MHLSFTNIRPLVLLDMRLKGVCSCWMCHSWLSSQGEITVFSRLFSETVKMKLHQSHLTGSSNWNTGGGPCAFEHIDAMGIWVFVFICVNKGEWWNKMQKKLPWPSPCTRIYTALPPSAASLLTHGGLLVWSLWSACRCQSYFLHPAHRQARHIQVKCAYRHPDCTY